MLHPPRFLPRILVTNVTKWALKAKPCLFQGEGMPEKLSSSVRGLLVGLLLFTQPVPTFNLLFLKAQSPKKTELKVLFRWANSHLPPKLKTSLGFLQQACIIS